MGSPWGLHMLHVGCKWIILNAKYGCFLKKWTINFGFVSAFVCSFVWSLLFCFSI